MIDLGIVAAWDAIHAATPSGWFVGPTTYEEGRDPPSVFYAADMGERSRVGHRSREWTAVGLSGAACVSEMARLPAGDWRG
jgi:hypothetical protein